MSDIPTNIFDFIIEKEVTSQEFYEKAYRKSEWPGGKSGITVGVGYDLGYASIEKIKSDWTNVVSNEMVAKLKKYQGYTGSAASSRLPAARSEINIPWNAAVTVFHKDMIDWSGRTEKALPNTEFLSRQCFGVLVSLTFNRGENIYRLPDDRYTEARMIRRHMINKEYDKIPIEIRSMKRLYPNSKGLRQRREEEANLFTLGLTI